MVDWQPRGQFEEISNFRDGCQIVRVEDPTHEILDCFSQPCRSNASISSSFCFPRHVLLLIHH